MTVTAQNDLSQLLEAFGNLLAASTAFQAFVGESTDAAALTHIHEGYASDKQLDHDQHRPRCIIRHMDSEDHTRAGTTGFESFGRVVAQFERDVPTDELPDLRQAYREFTNHIGGIINDLKSDGNGQNGTPQIVDIKMGPLGEAASEEQNGEKFFVSFWQFTCR